MADVAADLKTWSTTASSNSPADATTVGSGLADNLQELQKVVRQDLAHKGADIASAGTTDLGAVAGLMHDITGTTTITSFGTVSAGIWKLIKFEGALTLTQNATSLILPGGANITTASGDTALVMSEGSGNWRCHSYTKASGAQTVETPVTGMVLLETQTASSSSALNFTTFSSTYSRYVFEISNLLPATDASALWMRYSNDGGSSYLSDSSYFHSRLFVPHTTLAVSGDGSTTSDTKIVIAAGVSNGANEPVDGTVRLNNAAPGIVHWQAGYVLSTAAEHLVVMGSGRRSGALDAVRFLMSSGDIASGVIRMYGMRK